MEATPPNAWQPLTFKGVAAFAHTPLRRLLLVQFIVALLVALSVTWFLYDGYFPVINKAMVQLPTAGEVRAGVLDWRGDSPVLLTENQFLAVSVDLAQTAKLRSLAHVQVELGRTNLCVHSLLGYLSMNYPTNWRIAVNREELEPSWGAWQPAILAAVMVGVVVGLFTTWFLLATLLTLPVWMFGFYLNRDLNLRGSWRLSGAALVPGALLMVGAISFYDLGVMDPVQLGFVFLAHLLLGWIYLFASPFFLRHITDLPVVTKNPFTAGKEK